MSEIIPYNYSTPIPFYFENNGWFTNSNPGKKNRIFIQWAFGQSKCCDHKAINNGHEIWLSPFEILYTWKKCEDECGLSWKESRRRIEKCSKLGILIKNEEKSTQWWSVYRWNEKLLTKKRAIKDIFEKEENSSLDNNERDGFEKTNKQEKQKRATRTKKGQPEGQPRNKFIIKKGQPDSGDKYNEKGQPKKNFREKKGQPEGQHSSRTSLVFSISKDIDQTTTTKNEVDELSLLLADAKSIKQWLDKEASRSRLRKEGRQRIETKWHSGWFIPLQKFQYLASKYGSTYLLDQVVYMVKVQADYDEGIRKMKEEIQIPEAYLSIACKNNYAESLNQKKE